MTPHLQRIDTPLGEMAVLADDQGMIVEVTTWRARRGAEGGAPAAVRRVLAAAAKQLDEYFDGERREFDLPIGPPGTEFQRRAWAALMNIPFGETRSYAQVAATMRPKAVARAVGMANAANPVAIIVPCHRVIGADGSLTGYGGGLPMKRWLLEHEGALVGELFAGR